MKLFFFILTISLLNSDTGTWLTDFEKAKQEAAQSNKLLLLNFSGSDWCIPCIRLHKEIFESEMFKKYAEDNLVLVNADFPRLKKNQLSKQQVKLNERLADKYNPHGEFPLTLLLNASGEVLRQWQGYPNQSTENFINEVDGAVHAYRN